jgi:hypothetical protein
MTIYETDTSFYRYYTGAAWQIILRPGSWVSVTPTFTNLTLGNGTTAAKWSRVNSTIFYVGYVRLGSTSSVSTDPQVSVPFNLFARPTTAAIPYGLASLLDDSAGLGFNGRLVQAGSTTQLLFLATEISGTRVIDQTITSTVPFTWAVNDVLQWAITYETSAA